MLAYRVVGRLGLGEVASQGGALCIEAWDRVGSWQVFLVTDNIKFSSYHGLQGQGPAEPLWELEKALLREGESKRHLCGQMQFYPGAQRVPWRSAHLASSPGRP